MQTKYTDVQNGETQTKAEWLEEIAAEGYHNDIFEIEVDEETGEEAHVSYSLTPEEYFYKMVEEKYLVEVKQC